MNKHAKKCQNQNQQTRYVSKSKWTNTLKSVKIKMNKHAKKCQNQNQQTR